MEQTNVQSPREHDRIIDRDSEAPTSCCDMAGRIFFFIFLVLISGLWIFVFLMIQTFGRPGTYLSYHAIRAAGFGKEKYRKTMFYSLSYIVAVFVFFFWGIIQLFINIYHYFKQPTFVEAVTELFWEKENLLQDWYEGKIMSAYIEDPRGAYEQV